MARTSTGNTFPGTGASVDRAGATAWTNPGNVTADDTTDTTSAVPTDYLVTSNYGFAVPTGSHITGVTVRVEASETGGGNSNYIPQLHSDTTPTLIGAAKTAVTVSGTGKAITSNGGSTDLWSATLTPATVNATGFGASIWSTDTTNTLEIDYVTIDVAYIEPLTADQQTYTLTGNAVTFWKGKTLSTSPQQTFTLGSNATNLARGRVFVCSGAGGTTQVASDDFSSALSGYTTAGTGTFGVTSGYAYLDGSGGGVAQSAWKTGVTYENDSWSEVHVDPSWNNLSTGYAGVAFVRRPTTGTPAYRSCYGAWFSNANTRRLYLYKWDDAGSPTSLATYDEQDSWVDSVVRITAIGTSIRVVVDGTEVISVTDSTYTSGVAGWALESAPGGDGRLTSWSAGNATAGFTLTGGDATLAHAYTLQMSFVSFSVRTDQIQYTTSDNFGGTFGDGNLDSRTDWDKLDTDLGSVKLTVAQALEGGTDVGAVWGGTVTNENSVRQACGLQLFNPSTGKKYGLVIRATEGSTVTGYAAVAHRVAASGPDLAYLIRLDGVSAGDIISNGTILAQTQIPRSLINFSSMELGVNGSSFCLNVGGTIVLTANDSTYSSGKRGVWFNGTADPIADNFVAHAFIESTTLRRALILPCAGESFTSAFLDSTLRAGRRISGEVGTFTSTFLDVALNYKLDATPNQSFTLGSNDTGFVYRMDRSAFQAGAFQSDAFYAYGIDSSGGAPTLSCTSGTFTLTGVATGLLRGEVLDATPNQTFTLGSNATGLLRGEVLACNTIGFRVYRKKQGTLAFSDDFNRADGGLGANWTTQNGSFAISGNIVRATTTDTNCFASVSTSVGTFSDDQSASHTATAVNNSDFHGPAVRVTSTSAYYIKSDLNTGTRRIFRASTADGGWGSPVAIGTVDIVTRTGDTLTLEAVGTRISAFKNGVPIDSVTDANLTSGQPGIFYLRSNTGSTYINDFVAMDLADATNLYAQRTLTCEQATFTLGSNATGLLRGEILDATPNQTFTLGSFATGLNVGKSLTCSTGTFTLTGIDATLTYDNADSTLPLDSASFTLTGNATGLLRGEQVALDTVAFTLTGYATGLLRGEQVVLDTVAFTLGSNATGLNHGYTLTCAQATFAMGSNATALGIFDSTYRDITAASSGEYSLTCAQATFTLTGYATGLLRGERLVLDTAAFTLTGNATGLLHGALLSVSGGQNLITKSQEVDTWPKGSGITLTANFATAPDGTTTATKVDAGLSPVWMTKGVAANTVALEPLTASIYLKFISGTPGGVTIGVGRDTSVDLARITVNTSTGAITANGSFGTGVYVDSSVTDVGSGWWRFSVSGYWDGGGTNIVLGFTTSSVFYAWGGQIERGYSLNSYIPTANSAVIGAFRTLTGTTTALNRGRYLSCSANQTFAFTGNAANLNRGFKISCTPNQTFIQTRIAANLNRGRYLLCKNGGFWVSSVLFSDDFNRAGGALGSNWTAREGTLGVASNWFEGVAGHGFSEVNTATATFSADHASEVKQLSISGDPVGPVVRSTASGGYAVNVSGGKIQKHTWNVSSTIIGSVTCSGNANDVWRLQAVGTLISVYRNGILIDSVTDATWSTGQPGIHAGIADVQSGIGDNFYGSNVYPSAALNYGRTLSCSANQTFTLTGTTTALNHGYRLTCSPDSTLVLTGTATTLLAGRKVTADQQTYTLTGNALTLTRGVRLDAAPNQTYTLTGYSTLLDWSGSEYNLALETATFTLTGVAATFKYSKLNATPNQTFALTGNALNFLRGEVLPLDQVTFTLTGNALTLTRGEVFSLDTVAFNLTGVAANLLRGIRLDAAPNQTYALTGNAANLNYGRRFDATPNRTFTLTGNATALNRGRTLIASGGQNLLTRSQEMNFWSASHDTYADVATAPDGTLTADSFPTSFFVPYTLTHTVTGSSLSGATYTASVYVKALSGSLGYTLKVGSVDGANAAFVVVNTVTGAISSTGAVGTGTYVGSSTTDAGNGWHRISVSGSYTGTAVAIRFELDGLTGYGIWGGQIEFGAAPTAYITNAGTATSLGAIRLLTGNAAALNKGRTLSTSPNQTFVLTGIAANLLRGEVLPLNTQSFTLTGIAANLLRGARLDAAPNQTFVLTGYSAGLVYSNADRTLTANTGAFTLTGYDTTLKYSKLTAESGTFVLTGNAAGLRAQRLLVATTNNNLILYSEDAANGSWGKVGGLTVTSNECVAPDGTTTGDVLVNSGGQSNVTLVQTANGRFNDRCTLSVYLQAFSAAAEDSRAELGIYNNSKGGSWPAATISILSGPGSVVQQSIPKITGLQVGEWTRVQVTLDAAPTGWHTLIAQFYPNSAAGTQAGNVRWWGAQFEIGTTATDYVKTTSAIVGSAHRLGSARFTMFPSLSKGTFALTGNALNFLRGEVLPLDPATFTLTGTATGLLRGEALPLDSAAFTLTGTTTGLNHGYRLTCDAQSYALTGTATALNKGRTLSCSPNQTFALTGNATNLLRGGRLATDVAAFVLSGGETNLLRGEQFDAAPNQTFVLSGNATTFKYSKLLAESGAFTLTGYPLTFSTAGRLFLDPATFVLTGNAANLLHGAKLALDAGSFALTGNATALNHGYRLTAETGTFALTGIAANLNHGYIMGMSTRAFLLTGNAANLLYGPKVALDSGSFTLTGIAASFQSGEVLDAAPNQTFVLTGNAATLTYRKLALDSGSFALTGNAIQFSTAGRLFLDPAAFTLTGNALTLTRSEYLVLDSGSFALTGIDATLTYTPVTGYTLTADTGTFTLTGIAATFERGEQLPLDSGSFTLTGNSTGLLRGEQLPLDPGTFAFTGNTANLLRGYSLNATPQQTFTLTGYATVLNWSGSGHTMGAAVGAFALTGIAATLRYSKLAAATGSFALTGNSLTLTRAERLPLDSGSFVLTGNAAALKVGQATELAAGSFVLTGNSASLNHGYRLALSAGSFLLTGNAATLRTSRLQGEVGSFTLTGQSATLRYGRAVPLSPVSFTLTGIAAGLNHGYYAGFTVGSFTLNGQAISFDKTNKLLTGVGTFILTRYPVSTWYSEDAGEIDPRRLYLIEKENRFLRAQEEVRSFEIGDEKRYLRIEGTSRYYAIKKRNGLWRV